MSEDAKEQDDLLRAASGGDAAAVDELLTRHLPGLRAYMRLAAGRLLRTKESGSDLAQSVCREVLENADRFRFGGEAGFRQWLYATALRKIKKRGEYYRAERRDAGREAVVDARDDESDVIEVYRSFCSPSRTAIAREQMEAVERAFDALTPDQREVVLLARVVGLSRSEIAERMGRSEGSVRTLLYRALGELSEHL